MARTSLPAASTAAPMHAAPTHAQCTACRAALRYVCSRDQSHLTWGSRICRARRAKPLGPSPRPCNSTSRFSFRPSGEGTNSHAEGEARHGRGRQVRVMGSRSGGGGLVAPGGGRAETGGAEEVALVGQGRRTESGRVQGGEAACKQITTCTAVVAAEVQQVAQLPPTWLRLLRCLVLQCCQQLLRLPLR